MATNCVNPLYSIKRGCDKAVGGISTFSFAEFDHIASAVTFSEDAYGQITGATIVSGSSTPFKTVQQRSGVGSFNVEQEYGDNNGSIAYRADLSLTLFKNDYLLRRSVLGILEGTTTAIVKTADQRYWLTGTFAGLDATAGAMNWGQNLTDSNQTVFTVSEQSSAPPKEISSAVAIALLDADSVLS